MYSLYSLGIILLLSNSVLCSNLPSWITPCKHDVDQEVVSKCILEEAKKAQKLFSKGIPELGVGSLDPLNIGNLDVNTGALDFKQRNMVVKGLSKVEVRQIKLNPKSFKGTIVVFGNLTATADYDVKGRLLVLPINGQGKFKIKMENTDVVIKHKYKLVKGEDGKEHILAYDIKNTHNFGNVHMRMDGLFGNDKTIGETVNRVLNENWRDLMKDFGPPSVKAVSEKAIGIINEFYSKVPLEDLYFH